MPNTPSASATVQSTRITLPAPGTDSQVDARSGITFDFNINEATFERVGDDLQIKTDGGGTVTLTGFFVAEDVDALPVFTLADGQQVASGDFLKSLDVDITTAAGPSASSAPGSGGTSYADDTGSLLGGVDRLGSLGSDQWSQSTAAPETPDTVTVAAVAAGTAPASPANPETPPSPPLPDADFPAVMRFVLFRDTPETDPAMTGMCAEAAGSTQGATVQTEYGTATIAADGTITYTFTGTPEPGTQYIDYIKFTDANGNAHSVQVVVTDNPNYADDSDVYNTAGIINREAHDGTLASGGYYATSGDKNVLGDGNDVITYTRMDDGSLTTGAGQDTIGISGGIRNSAINAGNEANTVLVGGMLGTDAGTSSIYSQGGTITVQVDKNADNTAAMSAQNGGRSSITTEDATILVDAGTSAGGAWGMDASNGDNTIKATGTGSIEVNAQGATWATGISARGSGVNTLTSDTGNITVTANANTADGNAYGVSASGGENLLTSAADTDITATGRNAYGLSASGGGKNIIGTETAKAGDVTILANMKDGAPTGSGMAYGLYAADSGSGNIIDASGSVVIKTGTTGSHAQGMGATGGSNIVTADSVTIDAQSKTTGTGPLGGSASGMAADSGSNIINAATRVDINAQSTDRYAYGLHAQGGTNVINAAEAEVAIKATSVAGNAYGVYAPGGKNIITAEDLTIVAASTKGAAYGLSAMSGGKNIIGTETAKAGDVTILANMKDGTPTGSGTAYGLYAADSGSGNTIDASGSVVIKTGTTGSHAQGMGATGGSNTVTADSVTIDTLSKTTGVGTSGGSASGMAADSGSNIINAATRVDINAQSTDRYAYGLHAQGGTNTINAAEAEVVINAASVAGSAYGVYAPGGKNIITADDLTITAASTKGAAYGLNAMGGGKNIIGTETAKAGDVTILANMKEADGVYTPQGTGAGYGLYASGGANAITASGTVDIGVGLTTPATSAFVSGVYATSAGTNKITAGGDVNVNVVQQGTGGASSYLYGMNVDEKGSNAITSSGSVGINVSGDSGYATGIRNYKGSEGAKATGNSITADKDVNLTVTSNATATGVIGAMGMEVWGSTNSITAKDGTINLDVTAANAGAKGLSAWGGGKNILEGKDINITVEGHETSTGSATYVAATGLGANGVGAENILTVGNSLRIDVGNDEGGSSKHSAMGLTASNGGVNIIQAAEGSQGIEVHITVAAGSGGKAYALYASKDASGNVGTNKIIGGAGDDFISIKGDIYADGYGKNIIDLSKGGDNTVILDGIVYKGGLTLIEGAGHDTLILKAANMAEFNAKFKSWLTDLYKNGIAVEDVKLVVSSDMSEADRAAYLQSVQSLFPAADKDKISLINQEDVPTSAPSSAAPAAASADLEGSADPSPAAAHAPQPVQASLSRMAFAAAAFSAGEETQMTDAATYHAAADASLMAAPALGVYAATVEHADAAAAGQAPETAAVAQAGQLAHQGEELAAQAATDPEDAVHGVTEGPVLAGEDLLTMEGAASPAAEAGNPDDVLPGVHPEDALVSLGHENDWILLNNVDSNAPVTMQDGNDSLILQLDEGVDTAPAVAGLLPELWNDLAAGQNDTMSEETLDQVFTAMTCTAPLGAEATETTCSAWQDEAAVQTSAVDIGQGVFGAYQQDMSGDTLSLFMQQTIV